MEYYEEILVKRFTEQNIKSREEAVKALEERNFKTLMNSDWVIRERVEQKIKYEHGDVQKVIDQLQAALKNMKPNQSLPVLETHIIQEEEQWAEGVDIYLESSLYSIRPIERCESYARRSAKDAMWKIKHQPNGKDTERYLKIINKNKRHENI